MTQILALLKLLAIDAIFVGLIVLVLIPLAQLYRPAYAVLKRNFVGYFNNPTGYVFLCLFVLLTSIAAFWPHDFFVANLANLDQLNRWLPLIMLIFIPAITMSIWAEERRQGTDELLLTLPATDFDIVIGKYAAAALIFTCSLLFSQISNYLVLTWLAKGEVDTGLFFTTYLGYWCIGLSMLAIGMAASFLTNNMTVGFILGLMLNAPLAFTNYLVGTISDPGTRESFARWSLGEQFDNFGRGVISSASLSFFAMVTFIGIYVSLVLIGSRHWYGGKDGQSLIWHYVVRTVALVVMLVGLNVALGNYDLLRTDTTAGRVSSLSPDTLKLIRELDPQHAIVVDAFLSREVPEDYVKTKYSIISMLKEIGAASRGKIRINLHNNLEPFSDGAARAETQFGIKPQTVRYLSRGAIKDQEMILGMAVTCGLEKEVIPFFDYGLPVEYEVVRSISTAAKGDRKKVGIVQTDAKLMGGFDMGGGMMPRQIQKQEIINELEKQYKVEEVDPAKTIETGKYDVLLIVQPSTLGPQQLANVVEVVRAGQACAIFEDPFPVMMEGVVGTSIPKQPQGGMFGGGQPPPPKGDIRRLWEVLGIQPVGDTGAGGPNRAVPGKVVWQNYNPYPKLQVRGLGPEFVFVRNDVPDTREPLFGADPVTTGLEEILLPYPGGIQSAGLGKKIELTKLVGTAEGLSGIIDVQELQDARGRMLGSAEHGPATNVGYILAARIHGLPEDAKEEGEDKDKKEEKKDAAAKPVNVIYVCDIDLMNSQFAYFRAGRDRLNDDFNFRFDNVTFVLNVIDSLAGDDRFIEIRKRKPKFSTLQQVEDMVQSARQKEFDEAAKFEKTFKDKEAEAEAKVKEVLADGQKKVADLDRRRQEGESIDLDEYRAAVTRLEQIRQAEERRLAVLKEKLKQDRDRSLELIRRETEREVQSTQNWCKVIATVPPPIPPLLIGFGVFLYRRLREREGISKTRRR